MENDENAHPNKEVIEIAEEYKSGNGASYRCKHSRKKDVTCKGTMSLRCGHGFFVCTILNNDHTCQNQLDKEPNECTFKDFREEMKLKCEQIAIAHPSIPSGEIAKEILAEFEACHNGNFQNNFLVKMLILYH
jgi:hypothetical protein